MTEKYKYQISNSKKPINKKKTWLIYWYFIFHFICDLLFAIWCLCFSNSYF